MNSHTSDSFAGPNPFNLEAILQRINTEEMLKEHINDIRTSPYRTDIDPEPVEAAFVMFFNLSTSPKVHFIGTIESNPDTSTTAFYLVEHGNRFAASPAALIQCNLIKVQGCWILTSAQDITDNVLDQLAQKGIFDYTKYRYTLEPQASSTQIFDAPDLLFAIGQVPSPEWLMNELSTQLRQVIEMDLDGLRLCRLLSRCTCSECGSHRILLKIRIDDNGYSEGDSEISIQLRKLGPIYLLGRSGLTYSPKPLGYCFCVDFERRKALLDLFHQGKINIDLLLAFKDFSD
jgi:hypothetical protein